MPGLSVFLTIVYIFIGLASVVAASRAWRRRDLPGMQTLPLISLGVVLWAFSEGAGLIGGESFDFAVAITGALGTGLLPVAWLAFVFDYSSHPAPIEISHIPRQIPRLGELYRNLRGAALGLTLLISLLLASADYSQFAPQTDLNNTLAIGGFDLFDRLHAVWVTLILCVGVFLLIRHLLRSPQAQKSRVRNTMVGILAPMIVCTLELSELQIFNHFWLSPLLFTISQWAFLLVVMREGYLNILPLAHKTLLERIDSGMFVLDRHGVILDMNSAAGHIAAEPVDQVIRQNFPELFPEMRALYAQARSGALAMGEVSFGSGKERRYFDASVSPLRVRSGYTDGFLVEMQDITRRKTAEDSLSESEERYQTIVDHVQEGVIIQNALGMIIACNSSAERILGLSAEQLKGRSTTDPRWRIMRQDGTLLPGEEHPSLEALHSGIPQSDVILGIQRPDGSICWVSLNAQPLSKEGQSKPYAVISTLKDITDHQRTTKGLRESEDCFRELVESNPVATFIMDEKGEIQLVNSQAEQVLDYNRDELQGQSIEILFPEHLRQAYERSIKQFINPDNYREEPGAQATDDSQSMERPEQLEIDKSSEPSTPGSAGNILERLPLFIRRKDSTEFPADLILKVIGMEEGPRVMAYLVDKTEPKPEEENLWQVKDKLQRLPGEIDHHNIELALLSDMGDMLRNCSSSKEAYFVVASFAEKLFPGCSGALYIAQPGQETFEAAIAWGDNPPGEALFTTNMCWSLRRGRTHTANITGNGLDCQHVGPQTLLNCTGYLCAPMQAQGEVVGVFHLRWSAAVRREDIRTLAITVADHIATSLNNLTLRENLRMQSIRDPLTGLFNRAYMEEMFERELRRCNRNAIPLGVLVLDIDHFKDFVDTYGHTASDAVLKAIGSNLLDTMRGEDILCHYGGEKFVLVLPDSTLAASQKAAEKIRRNIRRLHLEHLGQKLREISISIGVAAYPEHGRSSEKLIQAADQALNQAKGTGRDRIHLAT